jgi:LPS export ABC transporter permease LptF/LPS export ABC transporter permease LptG
VFRLFDRYILKELIPPFFIGLLIYTFVLLMNQILLLSELFITRGLSFRAVLELLVYIIPSLLAFTVPMSILMGILAGLSRMSSDAEITAFKTLGISYKRLLRPVLAFSVLGFLITSLLTLYLAPQSNHKWVQAFSRSVFSGRQLKINPREFNESIPNTVIFIQDMTKEMNWKNIFVYFSTIPEEPKIILAKRGRLNFYPEERRAALELFEGTVHSYRTDDPETYRVTSFKRYEEELEMEGFFSGLSEKKRVREKDINELWMDHLSLKQDLESFSEQERDTFPFRQKRRELVSHWIEIHKKFALPFACFIFALLGLPLGAYTKKGGRTSGFTLSIGIILIYYILITAGEQMAMKGSLSPFIGMWGPNMFFLLVGLTFFIQSLREAYVLSSVRLFKKKHRGIFLTGDKKTSRALPRFSLPFPNILDRYIMRKYLLIFVFVFLSMLSVYIIVAFFERIDSVYENNKTITLLLRFIWYKLPEFVHYILPVTALTASLLCLGLLTKSNEITAMKACGISLYRVITPVLVLAGLVSFGSFYLQENILPPANKKAEQVWNNIIDMPARSYSRPDRRWVLSKSKDRIYHYRNFDSISSTFGELSIYDIDTPSWSLERRYFAKRATLKQGSLILFDSWSRIFAESNMVRFEKKDSLSITRVEDSRYFSKDWKEPSQMRYRELRDYIGEIEERGFETVRFKVDLNFKIAFPLASFIIVLLGVPFAFTMGKKGTLVGIGLSVAIAMVYWGAIAIFRSFGYVNYLSPFFAAWGPVFIFGSAGLYLLSLLKT